MRWKCASLQRASVSQTEKTLKTSSDLHSLNLTLQKFIAGQKSAAFTEIKD
jgi:hypothetical protein